LILKREFGFDFRINITTDGMNALLKLSCGDMRKALNILQAAHVGHGMVNDDAIYATTGSPFPYDIDLIIQWLFNTEFSECYNSKFILKDIRNIQLDKGLALADILKCVFEKVECLEMPRKSRIYLLENLADIEFNSSVGTSEKIQLTAMVGVFKNMLDITQQESVLR
jgi:replication factor C subunit 3/5